MKNLELT